MTIEKLVKTRSFNLILFTTFMLMFGYVTQRISLTVYLTQQGYSTNMSYSVATTYAALFAICSLTWSFLSKYLPDYERIIILAVLAISLGLMLVTVSHENVKMVGITLLIMGGSLYFTFMSLIVNNHFDCSVERQQGNHLYQLMFNLGSLVSVIAIGLMPITHYNIIYRLGSIITMILVFLLVKNRTLISNINNKAVSVKKTKNLILSFMSVFIFIFLSFKFSNIIRILSILGFVLGTGYILWIAFKEKNKNYLVFLMMLILCGFPYWLAISIMYSQFPIFLTHQVNSTLLGFSIPPMSVLSFDAIANVFFGYAVYHFYKQNPVLPKTLLLTSVFLIALAFLFLIVPFYLSGGDQKVNIFWPIFTVSSYAASEFLLLTTLTSQIPNLVNDKSRHGIFVSMQYLASALCASIAYYMIRMIEDNTIKEYAITQDMKLYTLMVIFTLATGFIYFLFTKFKIVSTYYEYS